MRPVYPKKKLLNLRIKNGKIVNLLHKILNSLIAKGSINLCFYDEYPERNLSDDQNILYVIRSGKE